MWELSGHNPDVLAAEIAYRRSRDAGTRRRDVRPARNRWIRRHRRSSAAGTG